MYYGEFEIENTCSTIIFPLQPMISLIIIKYIFVCLTMWSLHTASLHQAMRSTGYASPFKQDAPLWLVG